MWLFVTIYMVKQNFVLEIHYRENCSVGTIDYDVNLTWLLPRGTCWTNILHIKWKQNIMPPFRIDRIVILRWNYYFFTDNTCPRFQRQRPNDRFPWCFSDHAWVIQRHIEPDGGGARSIFVIEHRAPFSQSNIEVLAGKRRKTVFQTTVWNWRDRLE